MTQVVEANLYREASLLEEALERAHCGVTPADLALRVGKDQAGVLPAGSLHALLELASAVAPEDLDHAGPDPDTPLLPGLRGGDTRLLPGIGGVLDGDRGPGTVELEVLPPQGGVEGERLRGVRVTPGHQAMNETESEGHLGEGVHDRLRPPIGYPQNI
jgi:hypothetical protein